MLPLSVLDNINFNDDNKEELTRRQKTLTTTFIISLLLISIVSISCGLTAGKEACMTSTKPSYYTTLLVYGCINLMIFSLFLIPLLYRCENRLLCYRRTCLYFGLILYLLLLAFWMVWFITSCMIFIFTVSSNCNYNDSKAYQLGVGMLIWQGSLLVFGLLQFCLQRS